MTVETITPRDVTSTFAFHTATATEHDILVKDISGREQDFSLEKTGFLLGKHTAQSLKDWTGVKDVDRITKEYYAEMEQWLKELTGAPYVKVYNHSCRHTGDAKADLGVLREKFDYSALDKHQPALFSVHVDESSVYSPNILRNVVGDEAELLLHGRVMILNAWRPLKTVYGSPFAVCSAASVPPADLIPRQSPSMTKTEVIESLVLQYSPKHEWYYKFAQQPDEVLVFKQFDNVGKNRQVPHSAFVDKEFKDEERESIEVRAFVCWPDWYEETH